MKTKEERREMDYMPFDHGFYTTGGNWELCHSTGYEVKIDGEWWEEYEDREGVLHYGR